MIQPFCDVLWLYANIETYFTPNENYKKWKGDIIQIRKCDVKDDGSSNKKRLLVQEQEKTIYSAAKEYDPGYIWG